MKFIRNININFYNKSQALIASINNSNSDIRVDVKVVESLIYKENLAIITLYNITDNTITLINNTDTFITISANYKTEPTQTIFVGNLTTITNKVINDGTSSRDIICRPVNLSNKLISLDFYKENSTETLIKEIIKLSGTSFPYRINIQSYTMSGCAFEGNVEQVLNDLSKEYGFEWAIIRKTFVVLDVDRFYTKQFIKHKNVISISPESNFFENKTKSSATYAYTADNSFSVGNTVDIESLINKNYKVEIKIQKIEYSLSTHSNDWFVTITGTQLKNLQKKITEPLF